jgi:hypothetical protein
MLRKLVILVLVAAALLGFAAGATFVALEAGEVAVLRTSAPDGTLRETRVWVADDDGELWFESANPEKAFYRELLAQPEVEVVREGREPMRCRAVPDPSPAAHDRVRALLADKYGFADRWIGLLVDTSGSVAVRLVPHRNG